MSSFSLKPPAFPSPHLDEYVQYIFLTLSSRFRTYIAINLTFFYLSSFSLDYLSWALSLSGFPTAGSLPGSDPAKHPRPPYNPINSRKQEKGASNENSSIKRGPYILDCSALNTTLFQKKRRFFA